jgi:hypothetical protein
LKNGSNNVGLQAVLKTRLYSSKYSVVIQS